MAYRRSRRSYRRPFRVGVRRRSGGRYRRRRLMRPRVPSRGGFMLA